MMFYQTIKRILHKTKREKPSPEIEFTRQLRKEKGTGKVQDSRNKTLNSAM